MISTNFKVRFLLASPLAFLSLLVFGSDQCEAQWARDLVRADFGSNTQIQYAPDDPSTRSRLFKLQTGQAGAFYNCDGEEDKRNSPYICWKTGHGDRFHRTLWDVLNWKKDKVEIAQRICDGAGACCSGGGSCTSCQQSHAVEIAPQGTCGCLSCVTASTKAAKPTSMMQRSLLAAPVKANSGLLVQPKANVVGLVESHQPVRSVAPVRSAAEFNSVVESRGVVEEADCNCYACRMKRKGQPVTANAASIQTGATDKPASSTTASLLDRARSSRKTR